MEIEYELREKRVKKPKKASTVKKIKGVYRALNENHMSLAYFYTDSLPHPSTFIARRLFSNEMYDESFMIAADKMFFVKKIIFQNCTIQKTDNIKIHK